MSGSGISWAICKSAPRSRQITTPAPHRSLFYRPDALPAAQPTVSKHWRQYLLYFNTQYYWYFPKCHIFQPCAFVFRSPQDSCLYLVYDHDPQALFKSFDELQLFGPEQATDIISVCHSITSTGICVTCTRRAYWLKRCWSRKINNVVWNWMQYVDEIYVVRGDWWHKLK